MRLCAGPVRPSGCRPRFASRPIQASSGRRIAGPSQLSETTYFVTGANGFVGRHVCEMLLARRQRVVGLVRRDAPTLGRLGVECVVGDLCHPGDWQSALKDAQVVVHCAANSHFGNGPHYDAENVGTTANLLAAIHANVPQLERFVFVSTVGAVDRGAVDRCLRPLDEDSPLCPSSDYGRSKQAAEALVAASGLPFVIVRPALIAGSDMRFDSHLAVFARWVLARHPLGRLAWSGFLSVVDVEDLCEALLLCATHPDAVRRTFMCGGTPLALDEYFAAVKPGWRVPLRTFRPLLSIVAAALPFKLKSMLFAALVVDDRALRRLGWHPRMLALEAVAPVIQRERARFNPMAEPRLGQTVITGAASGLGRALAELLAPRRSRLLLIDRDAVGLAALAQRIPHARCQVADLADESAWDGLLAGPEWTAHPVAELYACAGVGRRGEFADDSIAAQIAMMRVNLLARMRLAHAAIATMNEIQFGRIVLVASSAAFQPLPLMSVYAASNAALHSFGQGVAYEMARRGVHVMTLCPGGMQTSFQSKANVKRNPKEKLMAPEVVAAEMMRGLARQQTTMIVSGRARAMALLARLLPRVLQLRLWGRLMASLR